MDINPFGYFITSLGLFGILMYVYNPIIQYMNEIFPSSGPYASAMLAIWGWLAIINLLFSGIRLIMYVQRRR